MRRQYRKLFLLAHIWSFVALLPALSLAQVPVDEQGKPYGADIEALGDEDIPRLSASELQELVGPIALYPDDLLAIVLPASTYPLQVIEAGRFLEQLESDPTLKPDESWDDSVVALLNYPEVVELMNEDLDWTWRLGEAVVAQQADVIAAVETFRDRAYAAGNLKSDGYQNVTRESGVVSIRPAADDIIYVPYYEPARVVVRQPRPVYYYYPQPCPVYYYPYPSHYAFDRGFFWGVTTAFTIGWATDHLSVFHHSYHGHPYFGYTYWDRWWYRRPSINVYNTIYVRNTPSRVTINRYYSGDQWRPRRDSGIVRRITRNEYYPSGDRARHEVRVNRSARNTHVVPNEARNTRVVRQTPRDRSDVRMTAPREREPITFRPRPEQTRQAPIRSVPRTIDQSTRNPDRRIVTRQREPQPAARQSATRQVTRQTTRDVTRQVTRETPRQVVRQSTRQVTREAPRPVTRQTTRQVTRQAPQRQVARQAPQRQVTRQAPRQEASPAPSRERSAPANTRRSDSRRSRER